MAHLKTDEGTEKKYRITIFGLGGTGTSSVSTLLGTRLGCPFISSGNIFRARAKELGLSLVDFRKIAQDDETYDRELDTMIETYGKEHDNFIVESRLPWYFIPDSLKVKLYCDFDERVRRIAARDCIGIDQAREETILREKEDQARYKKFYDIDDINDDNHFELSVDTSNSSVEDIVDKIMDYLNATV